MKCINFWNVHCRLELHTESSSTKPELIFMDQIEEVPSEFTQFKNEQCIQIKFKESIRTGNVVLTNPVSHFILLFVIYTTPAHMFFSYYVFIGKLLYTYLQYMYINVRWQRETFSAIFRFEERKILRLFFQLKLKSIYSSIQNKKFILCVGCYGRVHIYIRMFS